VALRSDKFGVEDGGVYERYNIKDRKDIIEAMDKLEQFHRTEDAKLEPQAARPN